MPAPDQPQSPGRKSDISPELSALAGQVDRLRSDKERLEADLNEVRRNMIKTLTASGELLKAVQSLDKDYFGGRFDGQAQAQPKSPQRDYATAVQVVNAAGEELVNKGSAFADSPVLRDHLATLVQAFTSLRSEALSLEEKVLQAINLPVKKDALPARSFPEDNPLALLSEAGHFVRDVQGLLQRTTRGIAGLETMLRDAEQAVTPVNAEQISAQLTGELKERDAELDRLRRQALAQQEEFAAVEAGLKAELAFAQEAIERENELRQGDCAEVRSLADEIHRLAAADPDVKRSDDLDITVSVLRESLVNNGSGIDALTSGAEAVLIGWAKVVTDRTRSVVEELGALRKRLIDAESRAQAGHGNAEALVRAKDQLHRLAEELAQAKAAAAAADSRADQTAKHAQDHVNRRDTELAALQGRLALAEAAAKQAAQSGGANAEALVKAKDAAQKLSDELAQAKTASAAAGKRADESARLAAESAAKHAAEVKSLQDRLAQAEITAKKAALLETAQREQARAAEDLRRRAVEAERTAGERADALRKLDDEIRKREAEIGKLREQQAAATARHDEERKQLQARLASGESASAEVARINGQLAELRARLQSAQEQLAARETELASITQARTKAIADHEASTAALQTRTAAATQLERDLNVAKDQLAETTRARQALETSLAARAEELKTRDADLVKVRDQLVQAERARATAVATMDARLREGEQAARAAAKAHEIEVAEARTRAAAAERAVTDLRRATEAGSGEANRLRDEGQRLAAEVTRLTTALEQSTAREKQVVAAKERSDQDVVALKAKYDEQKQGSESASAALRDEVAGLKRQLAAVSSTEQSARKDTERIANEVRSTGERAAALERELAQLRSARDQAEQGRAAAGRERDLLQARLAEATTEIKRTVEARDQLSRSLEQARVDAERARASATEATGRVEQLTTQLTQARTQLTTAVAAREEAAAAKAAFAEVETKLTADLASARGSATQTAADRDRLKATNERLVQEQQALGRRLEERESQLTIRNAELTRQLSELKTINARLEHERTQAEAARRTTPADQRENSGVWSKRLAEATAQTEEAKARAVAMTAEVERLKTQLADAEKDLAAGTETRRRIATLEQETATVRYEAAQAKAQAADAAAQVNASKGKLLELGASWQRKWVEATLLLKHAQAACEKAKQQHIEDVATLDEFKTVAREKIAELTAQVQAKKPG